MSEIITIKNEYLEVKISTLGAEIQSIKYNGEEKIFDDPSIWNGHAPVLFPICGGVLNDEYKLNGKTYTIAKHGFSRRSEFEVASNEQTSATFLLTPNGETKKSYPFDYEFRVFFKLNANKLETYYMVENKSNEKMYCNVGCHEAYALSSKIEDYFVEFENLDEIDNNLLTLNGLLHDKITYKLDNGKLPLNYDYFVGEPYKEGTVKDSIIVENIKTKRINLLKGDKVELSVYFNDFNHLVIWTKNNAPYIALEPWSGLPDFTDADGNIENKKYIDVIDENSGKTFYHSITFYD